jgi:predicted Zn-dependent protease
MNSLTKKFLIFLLVMAAVAAAGWFGRKAYKKHSEHRLVAQAAQCLEKRDLRNASLCLQRALQINPSSVNASEKMADMLETAGSPAAIGWRIRTAQLQPDNMQRRFAWAGTALKMQDPKSAANALAGLDDKSKNTAAFHKLSGALAWSQGNGAEAEKQYSQALGLEPTNNVVRLNLATIHLASTNQEIAQAARLLLQTMTSNGPLRSVALQFLAEDAETHKQWSNAVTYSRQIRQTPSSTFHDKIGHLKLLRMANHPDFGPFSDTLREEATKSSAEAFGFGQWLLASEGPTNALRWLQSLPANIRTNQPLPLIVTDCQMALKDWKGILDTLGKQDWGEGQYYRFALESLAQRSLGRDLATASAWQKALKLAAHRLDRLSRLAQVTAAWRWEPELTAVLVETTTQFPKEKWAAEALLGAYYRNGDTRAMSELLAKSLAANPSDNRLKNNLANIWLLRKSDLDKACRFANEAYHASTNNPFFASTYAYSLLLQNKNAEALKIMDGVKPEFLQIPSIAAYYGVVHAQSGQKEAAKAPLLRAEAASLLPEEKEIVRLAKAKL